MIGLRSLAIVFFAAYCMAAWADLDNPAVIDRVYVHPQTKQAALALVTNHPLDQATGKLGAKISTYTRYVQTGKLYEQYPEVARNLPVVVTFTVMVPPNAAAREVLNAKKKSLESQGFEVWVNVYDPKTKDLKRE